MALPESVKRRKVGGGAGCFSVLPAELLGEVVARLPLVDRCRLRAASPWWRDSFPDVMRLDHEASLLQFRPDGDSEKAMWLMAPARTGNRHVFYDACSPTRRFKTAHLPPLRFVVGTSPGGWVLHVDDYGDLHALNVLSGERLRPPPLTAFRGVARVNRDARGRVTGYECRKLYRGEHEEEVLYVHDVPYIVHSFYGQALIFFPEAKSSTGARGRYLVIVIHGFSSEISYAWEGDEHWTDAWPRLRYMSFVGLLPRRGLIYAVRGNGTAVSFDPCHPTDPGFRACSVKFRGSSGWKHIPYSYSMQYLVEISSRLWLVGRKTDHCKQKGRRGILYTIGVALHRLDEDADVWEEVEELGEDVALFLGVNQPLALSTRDYPQLEPGCIYFTDNLWGERVLVGRRPVANMGVYDTRKKTFRRDYHWSGRDSPWPAWILL